ncbi:MAG: hypothetical protein JXB49_24935 [Bacteroidales bacterium]|nr:hypothetical protein [Bacteroidales bacterium]
MERITYLPLIKHIDEHAEFYNQLFRSNEMRYGILDYENVSSWTVHVIEPIIKKVSGNDPENIGRVFKTLYVELLQLLGTKKGIVFEDEYHKTWSLLGINISLTVKTPERIVKALDSAIEAIRIFQPGKVTYWISLMEHTLASCVSVDEILTSGRVYAWICGMAHLRERVAKEYLTLREELKSLIKAVSSEGKRMEATLNHAWPEINKTSFVSEMGGYTGYGGYFTEPPVATYLENNIIVADSEVCCAFFADAYGKVLLPEIPLMPTEIIKMVSNEGIKDVIGQFGSLMPFKDISSLAMKDQIIVITRKSSHYIYVYCKAV